MSEALERLKAQRRGQRGIVTKYVQEVKSLLDVEMLNEGSKHRLRILSRSLEEKASVLKVLDEEIIATCPTEDIEWEIQESEEINDKIVGTRVEIDSVDPTLESELEIASKASLSRDSSVTRDDIVRTNKTGAPTVDNSKRSGSPLINNESNELQTFTLKPKLPKIELARFSGDVTKFCSFWESFESTVDQNPNLSAIDKFNYLNTLLEGAVARSIQGLVLSEANYVAATEILRERFGKKQQIISGHMDDLLKLPPCTDDQIAHLRLVYDRVHANVRGLEILGVHVEQYGSFLIPIVMSKLPADVHLQIAWVTIRDIWEIDELL